MAILKHSTMLSFAGLFLLLFNIVQNNLLNGQINFVVILFCVLFFQALLAKRLMLCSVYLAAAIATKLTPAIFLVYLLFRREYKVCGMTFLLTIVFTILLPMLFVGSDAVVGFYQWYIADVLPQKITTAHQQHYNIVFSLSGVYSELFHVPITTRVVIGCAAIVIFPIVFLQRYSNRRSETKEHLILFSLYMVIVLLISPMSETHHLANLFIPLFVIIENQKLFMTSQRFNVLIIVSIVLLLLLGKIIIFGYVVAILLSIVLLTKQLLRFVSHQQQIQFVS